MSEITSFRVAVIAAAMQLGGCAPAGGPQAGQAAPPHAPVASSSRSGTPPGGETYRPPSSSGAGVRSQSLVPGRPGRVFIFAAVDTHCQPLPAPDVRVTRAPGKGDVSFRPGQNTKLAASTGGTCLGVDATGTGVYYTARAGTSGRDSFSVSATLSSGETMTRDFSVEIAE